MNETSTEALSVVVEREIPHPPEKIWRALTLFPDASDRRKLLWDTPCKLLGFAS